MLRLAFRRQELLDHGLDQPRQVIGEARGDQVTVDDAGLVRDRGTGILEIDLDVPRGRGAKYRVLVESYTTAHTISIFACSMTRPANGVSGGLLDQLHG